MGLLLGQVSKWRAQRADRGAHAARGFVGGTTISERIIVNEEFEFQCRTQLCGWCKLWKNSKRFSEEKGFNAARGFVGGAAVSRKFAIKMIAVSMPHAALWVVQLLIRNPKTDAIAVSMPHAALWVVQRSVRHICTNDE